MKTGFLPTMLSGRFLGCPSQVGVPMDQRDQSAYIGVASADAIDKNEVADGHHPAVSLTRGASLYGMSDLVGWQSNAPSLVR
jgi:hypothetical protein